MDIGANTTDAFHQRNILQVVSSLCQQLDTTEVESDCYINILHVFALAGNVDLIRFFQSGMIRTNRNCIGHAYLVAFPAAPPGSLIKPAANCTGRIRRSGCG
ncbi:hypothetical protein SDC9_137658 [bioreactor metagenome]|uniref:Uncharacterized protein n=1 Tax=bioreactor metagenome TaxID=1076179 RepID=A0A645DMK3_9ZZZZ